MEMEWLKPHTSLAEGLWDLGGGNVTRVPEKTLEGDVSVQGEGFCHGC